jgi:hypothetical protein
MSQQTQSDPQSTLPQTRTAAERQRKDGHSRACRWAGVTARTREGKLIRDIRDGLIRHVGGAPSATQRALIERAVMLTVQLARMDAKALADGAMTEHASREYLAWSNTLTRTMKVLGLEGVAEKPTSLSDYISSRAA